MSKKSGFSGCLGTIFVLVALGLGLKYLIGPLDKAREQVREAEANKPAPVRPADVKTTKSVAMKEDATPSPTTRQISAKTLIAAYDANEVAADQQYKGEQLAVVGYAGNISKNIIGSGMFVTLSGDDDSTFRSVQCFFDKRHEDDLARIQPGAIYIISGRCDGVLGNVMLKDCELIGQPLSEAEQRTAEQVRQKAEQMKQKAEYEEKLRVAREAARLKEHEQAQQNRPAIAANDLRLAQGFLASGDKASYERLLRRIIEQYPETDTAKEANRLLGK